jgi:hypothetical protein
MIFDCHEMLFAENRCEWAIIRRFVAEYNRQTGKSFRAKEFPDLIDRNTPQPDALLAAVGEKDIVVERTTIEWPKLHIRDHKRMHCIGKRLDRDFGRQFASSPVVLHCNEATLPELCKLDGALDQLCSLIAAGKTSGNEPFPWRLRHFEPAYEGDKAPTGIGVSVWGEDKWSSPQEFTQGRNDALVGFAQEYCKALEHACKKFIGRPNEYHILLVQFLGDGEYILDDDVNAIVRDACTPTVIDEVWAAHHEWQDEERYEVGWQRLGGWPTLRTEPEPPADLPLT